MVKGQRGQQGCWITMYILGLFLCGALAPISCILLGFSLKLAGKIGNRIGLGVHVGHQMRC